MSQDFTPVFVPPAANGLRGLKLLRQAQSCILSTWPEAVYRDGAYRPPHQGVLMVMDEEAIKDVLVDRHDIFPQSDVTRRILDPVWRKGISTATGRDWKWQRSAAAPVFTPRAVEAVIPVAERAAQRLCQRWQSLNGPVEITLGLADAVTHVVFDAFLAAQGHDDARAAFSHWGDRLTDEMSKLNLADILHLPAWTRRSLGGTFETPAAALHALVADVLSRVDEPQSQQGCLLSLLAQRVDPTSGQPMSRDRLRDNIVGTLAAGRETTALALAWSLWLIAQHRPTFERVRSEVEQLDPQNAVTPDDLAATPYLRQVLMEALRLYSPAPQIVRHAAQPTMVAGLPVDEGEMIVVPIYAIHRHHRHWDRPNVFDPSRFDREKFNPRAARFRYMPFGGGPRICLGMAFALTEAHAMLIAILKRFDVRRDSVEPDLQFDVGVTLRPRNGLRIELVNRRVSRFKTVAALRGKLGEAATQKLSGLQKSSASQLEPAAHD